MKARPIFEPVIGAPYQPGQRVSIVRAIDKEVKDVSGHVGKVGIVKYLEYSCGCGQRFPTDPMVGVELEGGTMEEFWAEELGGSS